MESEGDKPIASEVKVHRMFYQDVEETPEGTIMWRALVEFEDQVMDTYIHTMPNIYEEAYDHLQRLDTVEPYILPGGGNNNEKDN